MQIQFHYHQLKLSYQQYAQMGYSMANCQLQHYYIYQQIGKGTYGCVYIGMDDRTKKVVAFKVLDLSKIQNQPNEKVKEIRARLAISEPQLMMMCDSENIIKCYDVYQNKKLKVMVIEYCNGLTLQEEINQKKRIPQNQAILIMRQLINAIAEMHRHRIIHRDIKAENILSHNGVYKIADLGFSKQMVTPEDFLKQTTLGTPTTMAPEVLSKQPYGLKADIWSIGVIFFQMVFGQLPYDSKSAHKICEQIKTKKILHTQQFTYNDYKASKEVTSFLREVLVVDPKGRLDWTDLVRHPLLNASDKLEQNFHIKSVFRPEQEVVKFKLEEYDSNLVQDELMNKSASMANHGGLQINLKVISNSQIQRRQKELDRANDAERSLYRWVQQCHLQCLKTQLIFCEIVEKIIQNELFDLTDRDVIEMLFCMLTRALNNMSVINVKLKENSNYIVLNLKETVNKLYTRVTACWKEYSDKLTETQNKVSSIIYDGLFKLFSKESFNQRDRYLTGIQSIEYTKKSQIQFTFTSYIQQLAGRMGSPAGTNLNYIKKVLQHYVKINDITLDQLQTSKLTFGQYIKEKVFQQ